jgi:hypothetical protein
MRQDASPILGLFIGLIAGAVAGSRGRSGGGYGALAGALFFILWDTLQLVPSPTGYYAAAVGTVAVMAIVDGAVWGGLWGLVGGWLGRKMSQPK